MTLITVSAEVTSVTATRASGSIVRRSQSRSRIVEVPVVTTMNRSSASRVIVTSDSIPPRSLSHGV